MDFPRVYVSAATHERVKRLAKKNKVTMKSLGDKIVKAGIKALALR